MARLSAYDEVAAYAARVGCTEGDGKGRFYNPEHTHSIRIVEKHGGYIKLWDTGVGNGWVVLIRRAS